jgi:ribulose-phosphate 3-epimerase
MFTVPEIIPSPGTNKNWVDIEKRLSLVKPFAKTIHIDVVDGIFAPNKTFSDPEPFKQLTKEFFCEVHLMVDDPIAHLKPWAEAGFHRFIGHIEKMPDQVAFVAAAQLYGEVGLAIDRQTPVSKITIPLDDLDTLLVMTIQAGASGQSFLEEIMPKLDELSSQIDIPLEVDGGINDETIEIAAAHGASRFVATSFLFDFQTPQLQYAILKHQLEKEELL